MASESIRQTYKGREYLLSIDAYAGADGPIFTVNAPVAQPHLERGQGQDNASKPKVEWKAFQVRKASDSSRANSRRQPKSKPRALS